MNKQEKSAALRVLKELHKKDIHKGAVESAADCSCAVGSIYRIISTKEAKPIKGGYLR